MERELTAQAVVAALRKAGVPFVSRRDRACSRGVSDTKVGVSVFVDTYGALCDNGALKKRVAAALAAAGFTYNWTRNCARIIGRREAPALTRAQRKFLEQTPRDGWEWDILTGPEAAMARRLIAAGHAVELYMERGMGQRIFKAGTPFEMRNDVRYAILPLGA